MFAARFFCNQQNHSDWIPVPLVCFDYRTWRTPFLRRVISFPVRVNDFETCGKAWSRPLEWEGKILQINESLTGFWWNLFENSLNFQFHCRSSPEQRNKSLILFSPPLEHQKTNYSAMLPRIPTATTRRSKARWNKRLTDKQRFILLFWFEIHCFHSRFRKQMEKCLHKHPWFICLSTVRYCSLLCSPLFRPSTAHPVKTNSSSASA